MILGLLACSAPLLPPDERPLTAPPLALYAGEPHTALGAALSIAGDHLLVGAPAAGEVLLLDQDAHHLQTFSGSPGLGVRVWLTDDGDAYALLRGVGVMDLTTDTSPAVLLSAPTATDADRCPDGAWVTSTQGPVACGPAGQILRRSCAGEEEAGCQVLLDEQLVDDGVGPDGAVGFWGDVPCWGDVDLAADPLPGTVRCADGTQVQGEDGDHLGVSLGDGVAGGVFNKWQVPMRARAVALDLSEGRSWSVDRAAERTPLVVVRSGGWMAVGVPGYLTDADEAGRVYVGRLDAW